MRCVVGVWADDPFDHRATCISASDSSDFVWTGAKDGVIVRYATCRLLQHHPDDLGYDATCKRTL